MVRIHTIQTGRVGVKEKYMYAEGQGIRRRLITLTDKIWLEPLPIYAWVIEHPEVIIIITLAKVIWRPWTATLLNDTLSPGMRECMSARKKNSTCVVC